MMARRSNAAARIRTIVPTHYMNRTTGPASFGRRADLRHRRGEPEIRRGLPPGDRGLAVQCGPCLRQALSHKLIANDQVGDNQWNRSAANSTGRWTCASSTCGRSAATANSARCFPEYSTKCNGEALMADTHMLFGMLGWGDFKGEMEEPLFPSSGSGQINVEFHLTK